MTSPLPFGLAALEDWMRRHSLYAGPVRLQRIGGGLSNLTYLVTTGDRTVVLRRPPPPPLPRGAHDMLREARVLRALADSPVPVPRVFAVAGAGEAMDVPCYVMEHLDGVVATETMPPALAGPDARRSTAHALIDVLAALHSVDWRAVGLADLGRPEGFLARQLDRLRNLITVDDEPLPSPFETLRELLSASLPTSGEPALLHGDLRLGNVMLAADRPAVLGVLDWELAGIGDPLADLGYTLATYAIPGEQAHALTALSAVTLEDGFPSREALAERYALATGRDVSNLPWYHAFQLFKLAVLYEYNHRKVVGGLGGDPYYADPELVRGLLHASLRALPAGIGAVGKNSRVLDHQATAPGWERVR
jgi:aminoglycoside phosphotransferase (APT) family kinase protein